MIEGPSFRRTVLGHGFTVYVKSLFVFLLNYFIIFQKVFIIQYMLKTVCNESSHLFANRIF